MKINDQFNRIAKQLQKQAKQNRVYAIPLLTQQSVEDTRQILEQAKIDLPEAMKHYWFSRGPYKLVENKADKKSEGPLHAYVAFRDEKAANYVAQKLRWKNYDPPVFQTDSSGEAEKSLKSYKVSVTPHRPFV